MICATQCRFARDNCPSFLVEGNFNELKAGKLTGLNIFSGTFMQALLQRKYSKVSGSDDASIVA